MSDETKFRELEELARLATERARMYEQMGKDARKEAQDLTNQAISLLAPFAIGDVVEYEEKQGYRNGGTLKKIRMIVRNFHFSNIYDGFEVTGWQVNKEGKETATSKSFYITTKANPFIKIIKAKE